MSAEKPSQHLPYFEVNYIKEFNGIEIIADEAGLQHLCHYMQILIKDGISGSHYDFQEFNGMDGNVERFTIQKGESPR